MDKSVKRLAIYGSSGFAREVLPLVREQQDGPLDIVFVDDDVSLWGREVAGISVVPFEKAVSEHRSFTLAIADSGVRMKLASRCQASGVDFFNVVAKSSISYDRVDIGVGLVACANVVMTSDIKIGVHFHANIYSYVAHDCVIGDYVTFAPRVSCNGNVHIHDGAYIGTAAVIKQGRPGKPLVIGAGAIVGMGAVVTKDVEAGSVVVGNPARVLAK